VEHRQVEDRPAISRHPSGDDTARFLRELRQLRDGAGLGQAELAARAHYPYDRIKAAEVGPTLPDLPVLSAYVRGCGGTTEEWEERWRSLTSAPTLPLLDTRPAGCSNAASAGARIGSISPVAETPDPSIIMAALDRVAEEMAVGTPSAAPLPSRSGLSTIEQRPSLPASSPTAPAAAKSAAAKASSAKVSAWETTTMRTAWSSGTGPLAREAGADGPTTPTGARPRAAENAQPATASAGPVGASAATSERPEPAGTLGTRRADGSGGAAEIRPTAATGAGSTKTAPEGSRAAFGPISVGRRPQGLSRTTVAALIAIAVCVFVALLAMLV
jgi:hypothetical protein